MDNGSDSADVTGSRIAHIQTRARVGDAGGIDPSEAGSAEIRDDRAFPARHGRSPCAATSVTRQDQERKHQDVKLRLRKSRENHRPER